MSARHWIASYGDIPTEIDPDRFNSVTDLLDPAIQQYRDKPAFHALGQSITYGEVGRLSTALAAYLQHDVGIKKGDRVAVMMPNIVAFPITFIALARLGAIQVNVNPLYTPRELEHQLNDAGATAIVVYDGSTPTLAEIIGHTPALKTVITSGLADGLANAIPGPAVDARLTGAVRLVDAIARGAGRSVTPVAVGGHDPLFLQYTGGTTGLSKGATLSHRNLIANIEQYKAFMPQAMRPGEEVVVTAIPLYHIFALMVNFLSYFSVGAENWLVANPRDAGGFVGILKAARPTIFTGVNTLFAGLVAHPGLAEVDWSRLQLSAGGGAAIISSTSERWKAVTGSLIREGYGLSETSPIVSFNPYYINQFSGTTGLPMPSTDVVLLDDNDRVAGVGGAGEVCVKGPKVMQGYWQQPEANARAFTADGYFRTGDIGVFDERGFLKIVDRKKDMIIVSGFNVYPNEVEEVATACPGVAECACVGMPDDKTGEAVKLVVVRAAGADLTEEALIAYCRANMAAYKVPRQVRFIEALPKSTVGKILRRELRGVA